MKGIIDIDGRKFTLQHPGAFTYYKKKKQLQLVDTKGFIQWDEQKLFDFCFGQDGEGTQVVMPEGHTRYKWRDSGTEEGDDIPSLEELQGVWAAILPPFLNGNFSDPSEDSDYKWTWSEKSGGNKRTDPKADKPDGESTDRAPE